MTDRPPDRRLIELFGEELAGALDWHFQRSPWSITAVEPKWERQGYSRARLVAVVLEPRGGREGRRITCVAKVFPPGAEVADVAGHEEALTSQREFAQKYIADVVFGPIRGPAGEAVLGLGLAGGSFAFVPLAEVDEYLAPEAFRAVTAPLGKIWNKTYGREIADSWGDLLRRALGKSIGTEGWLYRWAAARGLTEPIAEAIEIDGAGVFPNPIAVALGRAAVAPARHVYLTGRSHNDLHVHNVLVPREGGAFALERFQLIDLAGFSESGLLSRDPANLFVSLLCTHLRDDASWRSLLGYLVNGERQALQRMPRWLAKLAEAFLAYEKKRVTADGFVDQWEIQLKTSLVAAGLWHSAHEAIPEAARRWCFLLAVHLTRSLARIAAEPPAERTLSAGWLRPDAECLNHEGTRLNLRAAILSPRQRVILVHGEPGIGKSTLVRKELERLEIEPVELMRGAGLTGHALATQLEQLLPPEPAPTGWVTSLERLEAIAEALGDRQVVVVVECAERLMAPTSPSLDLDEAFAMLARLPSHRITLLMISRTPLPQDAEPPWLSLATTRIEVKGLGEENFLTFLDSLGSQAARGLAGLPLAQRKALHGLLGGNPRLAEIVTAVVTWIGAKVTAGTVVENLAGVPAGEISRHVMGLLIDGLNPDARKVVQALDAFAVPVPADMVARALPGEPDHSRVEDWLNKLVDWKVIRRTKDRRFYLPEPDAEQLLWCLPEQDAARKDLLHRAANVLSDLRKDKDQVHTLADLESDFAELKARDRAGLTDSAFGLLERMDPLLRRWGCESLLLAQRRKLKARGGGSDEDTMENDNALGDLYTSGADHRGATEAFDDALRRTSAADGRARGRILSNRAGLYWIQNYTELAEEDYRRALHLAGDSDHELRMSALEGLANCHRRWGQYNLAIEHAEQALAAAHELGSPRSVTIVLKLARWHNDLKHRRETGELLRTAEREAVNRGDPLLLAAFLDSRADLRLDRHKDGLALADARQAVGIALDQHHQELLRRTRTTLCLAWMRHDKLKRADQEITAADWRRGEGRSLDVLALRALVAVYTGAESRELFVKLMREAAQRRDRDGRDFAALDLQGVAICGLSLTGERSIGEAVRVFQDARDATPATPILNERLKYLIEFLDRDDTGRFDPVIETLERASQP